MSYARINPPDNVFNYIYLFTLCMYVCISIYMCVEVRGVFFSLSALWSKESNLDHRPLSAELSHWPLLISLKLNFMGHREISQLVKFLP